MEQDEVEVDRVWKMNEQESEDEEDRVGPEKAAEGEDGNAVGLLMCRAKLDQLVSLVPGSKPPGPVRRRAGTELQSLRTMLESVLVRQVALASDVQGLLSSFPASVESLGTSSGQRPVRPVSTHIAVPRSSLRSVVAQTKVGHVGTHPPPFRQLPTRTGCLTIVVNGEARFYRRRHVVGTIRSFAAAVETGCHAHIPFERCIDA